MADEGLKDFTVGWIVAGFLMFCMVAFSITFMFNNNPLGLSDESNNQFNTVYSDLSGELIQVDDKANNILNITSITNPEVSDLGSRDSVATSYSSLGAGVSYWTATKVFISWIFSGAIGQMLVAVLGGLITLLGGFYVYKAIRGQI